IETALLFLRRDGKKQKVQNAVLKIFFNLAQDRRAVMANVAAQTRYRFFLAQPFNDKKGLYQLSSIEFSLCAKIAQMRRASQTHQTLHHDSLRVRTRSVSD